MRASSAIPLLGLCFCAVSLHAQDDTGVELSPLQVTAGRQRAPEFSVAEPVTVLSAGEIRALNPQVMTQALAYQPGAFFQQTGPGQGVVIVRGLKGAEVLHLVDGMRLNNAFFRTAPSQYIALVDPQNMGQLELLRGPYATLYGSDAMGGVVQVLTPEHRFAGEGWDWTGAVRGHYASDDLARTARIEAATGSRDLSLAAGLSFARYGERRLPNPGQSPDGSGGVSLETRVGDTDYLSRGYDLKAIWTPAAAHELMASMQHFALPALPRYNETVPGYRASGVPTVAQSVYDNDRTFYHLRYRRLLPVAGLDDLEVHLGRQVVNDDRFDREQNLSRDTFEFNRSTLTGLTAQARAARGDHALLFGFELYRDQVSSRSVRETPPGSGTLGFNSPGGFQSRFPDGSRAEDAGLFVLDQWTFAPAWRLDLGGRYNWHRTVLAQADRASGSTLRDQDVSGNLGLRRELAPALAWTSNLGRGFRAPNIENLATVGRRSGTTNVQGNPDLQPETITSIDTGLKFSGERWQGEATAFYSDYRDRITLVVVAAEPGPACPDDGNATTTTCSQNRNIARAFYYGIEGGVRYAIDPALSVRAVVNYTFGQQESGGTKTPGNRVPPLNGQLALAWRAADALTVEPSLYFAGRQDRLDPADQSDARINPRGTGGYAVANLRLGWTPRPAYRLQLDGTNLLDKQYREHASGIDGPARGIALTAEARF